MRTKGRTAAALAALALLAFIAGVVWVLRLPSSGGPAAGDPAAGDLAKRVRLDSPAAGATVTSPLSVTGTAPGPWFFEATFPVRLLDAEGRAVADTFAEAEGEWMTESPVPFHAALVFEPPPTEEGWLVLERANPSGLPEHAREVRFPVRFPAAVTVRVFFPDSARDPSQLDCRTVYPAERRVPADRDPARAALEALLAGPTSAERETGYLTSLPPGATLRSVSVADGVARADFDATLEAGVAGSCRVLAIRAQIEETLRALPGVRRVVISVEGRTEQALQP